MSIYNLVLSSKKNYTNESKLKQEEANKDYSFKTEEIKQTVVIRSLLGVWASAHMGILDWFLAKRWSRSQIGPIVLLNKTLFPYFY